MEKSERRERGAEIGLGGDATPKEGKEEMVMIHVYSQRQIHHLNCAVLSAQEKNGGGLLPWPPLSPSCPRFSLSNLLPYFRSWLRKSHIPASFFFSHIRPPILFTQFLFLCFFLLVLFHFCCYQSIHLVIICFFSCYFLYHSAVFQECMFLNYL